MDCISDIKTEFTYQEYLDFQTNLLENEQCTGPEQSPDKIEFTKLNAQRMKRVGKQFKLSKSEESYLESLDVNWRWIVLVESWCGDAAQNLPIIAAIASHIPNLKFKVILRDENPHIIETHLTNGGKAIPKLICCNLDTGIEIGTWGPRPAKIQDLVTKLKRDNPEMSHADLNQNLHAYYAKNKGIEMTNELLDSVKSWTK